MNVNNDQIKHQFWILSFISICFLLFAPSVWHFTPDGGIYVGTAQSIVEKGEFRFNGYPNLLYYPGFSGLLSLPVMVFGINFHILHLFCVLIVVATLWLAKVYFSSSRYGIAGMALPILLACNTAMHWQIFYILSDGAFLAIVLCSLYVWRIYIEKRNTWGLISCFVLVAFAPMVRFQGLFLCIAFTAALIFQSISKAQRLSLDVLRAIAIGSASFIPFSLWTWRNVKEFTPDTFNMANQFFFGMNGLALFAHSSYKIPWVNSEWKYPLYSAVESVRGLSNCTLGDQFVKALPFEIVFLVVIFIVFSGSFRWFRLATNMERIYVITCGLFVLKWILPGHSIYSDARQMYYPFLPFILISGGLGLNGIYQKIKNTRFRHPYWVMVSFLAVLIFSNGVSSFINFASPSNSRYFQDMNNVILEVKNFMDKNTTPDVPIATTDWGVMPFSLKRTCYQVLNDGTHIHTLKRMNKYQTRYLVILDRLAVFPPHARKMVKDIPELFRMMFDEKKRDGRIRASVYEIDLEKLASFLNSVSKKKIEKRSLKET